MTRKRFKKLLMSRGYSRDNAERLSNRPKVIGVSYQTYWDDNAEIFKVKYGIYQLNQAWGKIQKTMRSVAKAIDACWREAFNGATEN